MYSHEPYIVHVIRLSLNIDRKHCETVAQVISFCLHNLVELTTELNYHIETLSI